MRFFRLVFICCILSLSACNNKAISPSLLNSSNLESSFITIAPDSAYSLKTSRGTVIIISAGTFKVRNGKRVKIEVKEALTMQDILLAGLTTESNGRPLMSGGMIYFNATSEGRQLELNKPVGISMPSEIYDPNMQLFKGEMKEDSIINWVDPEPLDSTPNAKILGYGKALFNANCANCHKVRADFTGPSLAGISNRAPNRQWVYDFIKRPAALIGSGDVYAKRLFNAWRPTLMTAFPNLQNSQIDAILAYVANEEKLIPTAYEDSIPIAMPAVKVCYDTILREIPPFTNTIEVNSTTEISGERTQQQSDTSDAPAPAPALDKGFDIRTGIYSFEIEVNGWYNIDKLMDEKTVIINASVAGTTDAELSVYLFFPEKKILSHGTLSAENKISFDYADEDNHLQAPAGAEAILLVFGSDQKDLYYAVSRFRIKAAQAIILELTKTTEAGLLEMIRKNKIGDFKIDIYKKEEEIIERPCDDVPTDRPASVNTTSAL